MSQYDILQRIPYNQEFTYDDVKGAYMDDLEEYLEFTNVIGCVNSVIEDYEMYFSQNGMKKLVLVISIMLFLIEHDEVDRQKAFSTKWDLLDFETGNYDDLFTPDDLAAIKKDVAFINEYFAQHPELVEGVEEKRCKVQTPINYKYEKPNIDTKIIITDYQYDFIKPYIPDVDNLLASNDFHGLCDRINQISRDSIQDTDIKEQLREINRLLFWYNRIWLD